MNNVSISILPPEVSPLQPRGQGATLLLINGRGFLGFGRLGIHSHVFTVYYIPTTITHLRIWLFFCTYVHVSHLFQHEAVVYLPEAASFFRCQQQLHNPGSSAIKTDLLVRSAYLHTALEWPPKNSNALHASFLSVRPALAKEHRPSVS